MQMHTHVCTYVCAYVCQDTIVRVPAGTAFVCTSELHLHYGQHVPDCFIMVHNWIALYWGSIILCNPHCVQTELTQIFACVSNSFICFLSAWPTLKYFSTPSVNWFSRMLKNSCYQLWRRGFEEHRGDDRQGKSIFAAAAYWKWVWRRRVDMTRWLTLPAWQRL